MYRPIVKMTKTSFPSFNTVHSILDTEVNLNSTGVHSPVLMISHLDNLSASDISFPPPGWQALFSGTTESRFLWRLSPALQRQLGWHAFKSTESPLLNWDKYVSSKIVENDQAPVLGFQLFVEASVMVFFYLYGYASREAARSWNPERIWKF